MKALDIIKKAAASLTLPGIENPSKEAELIIRQGLNIDTVSLYRDNPELSVEQSMIVDNMVRRRSNREPLQYIVGHAEFLGLKIAVGPGVLIPRPETELMAENAIKAISYQLSAVSAQDIKNKKSFRMLDLCTGSGCLALALAKEFPDSQVIAADISNAALSYARKNAESNNIGNVKFICGYLFDGLSRNAVYDFIISNPPYIRSEDIDTLQDEIKDWEPLNALDGGVEGLDFYRQIISDARIYLRENGILMFELGAGYADAVAGLLIKAGYKQVEVSKDYSGIERIISAHK